MKNKLLLVFLAIVLVVSLAAFAACKAEEEEAPVEFSLKITAIGEGTTSPAPGTSTITEGESVTVKATPNPGYQLGYWEGDVSGTTSPITVKMTSDKSVVAVFVEGVAEWEWPETLFVGTMGPTTSTYATAVAWTTPLAADTGMKCRLVAEMMIPEMLTWVITGETLCCSWSGSASDMFEAIDIYATRDRGPRPVAFMYVSSKTDIGFCTRGDSTIKTPQDITPGTKIIYYVWAPKTMYNALLAWGNVSPDDVVWVPTGDQDVAASMIIDGTGDLVVAFPTSPGNYDIEYCPQGMSWIELNSEEDPEGAARFLEVLPGQTFGVMSTGCPSCHGKWGIVSINGYMVRQDADPDLIYNLTKWLAENYDRYKDGSPDTPGITLDSVMYLAEHNFKPLHDGTVRYLEEKGLWTEAHEARRQANTELLDRWIEAYQRALEMADEQGIVVDPANEEWMELWENYKEELGLPRFDMFPQGLD